MILTPDLHLMPKLRKSERMPVLILYAFIVWIVTILPLLLWHAVAQLVEALRYKSEGRGFDS